MLVRQPVVKATDYALAKRFAATMKGWPVYLITGHGCICPEGEACGEENTSKGNYTFVMPDNTIMMSFAQGGDICADNQLDTDVIYHAHEIPKFAAMHSASDVQRRQVEHYKRSFFANLKRAAPRSPYPNVHMRFFHDEDVKEFAEGSPKGPVVNRLGVFRIDTLPDHVAMHDLTNENDSLIKQPLERSALAYYLLSDVIEMTYEVTNTRRGIFVLVGCMNPCKSSKDRPLDAIEGLDEARTQIHLANTRYNSQIPTVTKKEARALGIEVPLDAGTRTMTSTWTAANLVSHFRRGLIDPTKKKGTFTEEDILLEEYDRAIELDRAVREAKKKKSKEKEAGKE
jgi:hypothetical protein